MILIDDEIFFLKKIKKLKKPEEYFVFDDYDGLRRYKKIYVFSQQRERGLANIR